MKFRVSRERALIFALKSVFHILNEEECEEYTAQKKEETTEISKLKGVHITMKWRKIYVDSR